MVGIPPGMQYLKTNFGGYGLVRPVDGHLDGMYGLRYNLMLDPFIGGGKFGRKGPDPTCTVRCNPACSRQRV